MKEVFFSERKVEQFTGNPLDLGWIPHERETWTHRYAKLKNDTTMRYSTDIWKNGYPELDSIEIKAGTTVKIVMVSRFGDIGITEKLDKEHGYGARVNMDDLYDYKKELENEK
jgi:hypothetical protein